MTPATVLKLYDTGKVLNISPLPEGRINTNFFVQTKKGKFILQKLAPYYNKVLIEDILRLNEVFKNERLQIPRVVKLSNNQLGVQDGPRIWRMYEYIENDGQLKKTPEKVMVAAATTKEFHKILKRAEYKPHFKQDGYGDNPKYFREMKETIKKSKPKPKSEIYHFYELVKHYYHQLQPIEPKIKLVIHGDTAFRNFLFRDNQCVAIVDLDTIMVGSLDQELGKGFRNCCRLESTGLFDKRLFEACYKGYFGKKPAALSKDEVLKAIALDTIILAARHITDYFKKDYWVWNTEKPKVPEKDSLQKIRKYFNYFKSIPL